MHCWDLKHILYAIKKNHVHLWGLQMFFLSYKKKMQCILYIYIFYILLEFFTCLLGFLKMSLLNKWADVRGCTCFWSIKLHNCRSRSTGASLQYELSPGVSDVLLALRLAVSGATRVGGGSNKAPPRSVRHLWVVVVIKLNYVCQLIQWFIVQCRTL